MSTREEDLEAALRDVLNLASDTAGWCICGEGDMCADRVSAIAKADAAFAMPKDEACKSCKECCSGCENLCERDACRCEECKSKDRARLLRVAEAAWKAGYGYSRDHPGWADFEETMRQDLAAIVEGVK